MKAKEIRELSVEEIKQRIAEEKTHLHHLRFQHAIADIQNPIQLRHLRRLIARLTSILQEKETAPSEA